MTNLHFGLIVPNFKLFVIAFFFAVSAGCGDSIPVSSGDKLSNSKVNGNKDSNQDDRNDSAQSIPATAEDRQTKDSSTKDSSKGKPTLEGAWQVTRIETQGHATPVVPGMPDQIEVNNGVFNSFSRGTPIESFSNLTVKFDPRSPYWVDLIRIQNGRVEVLPSLLMIREKAMKIAMPLVPPDKKPGDQLPRPQSFDTSKGRFMVLVAVRKGAEAEQSKGKVTINFGARLELMYDAETNRFVGKLENLTDTLLMELGVQVELRNGPILGDDTRMDLKSGATVDVSIDAGETKIGDWRPLIVAGSD